MHFKLFVLSVRASNSEEVFMSQVGMREVGLRLLNAQVRYRMRHLILK